MLDRTKLNHFVQKIMHSINKLELEPQISVRNLLKLDCPAKPVSTFANRALSAAALAAQQLLFERLERRIGFLASLFGGILRGML